MSDYQDAYCHTASIEVAATPEAAFGWMCDGLRQGEWALGSLKREAVGDGLFRGVSWFDDGDTYVRITADRERLMIHYEVGRSADALQPRTVARVVPGPVAGLPGDRCVVTLMVWRDLSVPEDRWRQQCIVHKAEMYRIRHLVETGAAGRAEA
jgi:hypothetical protein